MPNISVMLVDDHAVVRAGYRLLLSQCDDITVAHETGRGEEACRLHAEARLDVIVMDINLPGIGGLASIRRICARDSDAKILAFSIHDEPLCVMRALEAGARGYISKTCAPEILVEAVVEIAAGASYIEPEIAQRLAAQRFVGAAAATDLNSLSAREFDVFCLLAGGHTAREAADELCLGYKTVANYVTGLKRKLNVNTTAEMARIAYQYGILKR